MTIQADQMLEYTSNRSHWMALLAKADFKFLEEAWNIYDQKPSFEYLRKPETGLVMVRGRMGGKGRPFNLGEATVTRCSVKTETGHSGHAYLMGRNHRHAEIAAQVDAMMQDSRHKESVGQTILKPLYSRRMEALKQSRSKTAATKVDFFTMVRGEDD